MIAKFLLFLAFSALFAVALSQSCPAGTCPTQDTCCQLADGSYGCCPYPKADCCSDHQHCCPNGYTCDLSKGQCTKGASHGDFIGKRFTKIVAASASAISTNEEAASCPAGTCPTQDTCCQLADGSYGCCPYPKADCCSDHQHCCPNGYTCDLSKGTCTKSSSTSGVIASKAMTKITVAKVADAATCPAGTCPTQDTCCQLADGSYGCCPYPKADCCSDHQHCCPNGYTCDLSKGTCTKGGSASLVRVPLRDIKKN